MQGIGNDFVVLDAFRLSELPSDLEAFAARVCDRRFGVGADGLLLVQPGDDGKPEMRMWNPDGTVSEMCGNGLRCAARLLWDRGHAPTQPTEILTGAGWLVAEPIASDVRIAMGRARLRRDALGMTGEPGETFVDQSLTQAWRGTAVSMGNPHLVIPVPSVEAIDLPRVGPKLEHHREFLHRTNVHFVEVKGRGELRMRTWERGAGITLACGTGACAVASACSHLGLSERVVRIQLPGGFLRIELEPTGSADEPYDVFMTGPAETVFSADWCHST